MHRESSTSRILGNWGNRSPGDRLTGSGLIAFVERASLDIFFARASTVRFPYRYSFYAFLSQSLVTLESPTGFIELLSLHAIIVGSEGNMKYKFST